MTFDGRQYFWKDVYAVLPMRSGNSRSATLRLEAVYWGQEWLDTNVMTTDVIRPRAAGVSQMPTPQYTALAH